ncbi:MAG: hypothetical protein Q8891_08280 [Bacteroidota bacterium]|nr:hypothetical protein [Bacteroidota bacterium]
MKKFFLLISIILNVSACFAQAKSKQKLKVFIDCSRTFCDQNYFRSEIKVVDFLRDPLAANVHVLITSQHAGGGGRQYQMIFYGQNNFDNYNDTLLFMSGPSATNDEKRKLLTQYLMLGLAPLVAKTDFAPDVKISMNSGNDSLQSLTSTTDKWNYWVFKVNLNGNFNYDKVYKSNNYSTSFSANRTTDKLKLNFSVYKSLQKSTYQYDDTSGVTKYSVKNSNYGFYHSLVKTISKHWSYGYRASYSNSTFSNFQSKISLNPALEYNIFNYKDVNNKFFVIRYGADVIDYRYYDTTIYNKKQETLYGQSFSAAITLNQKWGTFNSGLYYHSYFKDLKLNHVSLVLNLDARITGGLSFNVYSSGSFVHDQLNLAKGDVSAVDVLSRSRQLASTFNFYTALGFSYRFGSKLNNYVNPRFDGYGGF